MNVAQMGNHALPDIGPFDFAQLEHQRIAEMLLLNGRLADEEEPRLAVVIGEAFRPQPDLGAFFGVRETAKAYLWIFTRAAISAPAVRLVVGPALGVAHRHMPVLLEVSERTARRIDGDVREVGTTKPL
jgi:hypothetical protein